MSFSTDVVLLFHLEETWDEDEESVARHELPEYVGSAALKAVNAWLMKREYGELVDLRKAVFPAGNRGMLCEIYGGSFDGLAPEEFRKVVFSQAWRVPEYVQLLLKHEEEDVFTMNMNSDPPAAQF